MPTTAPSASTLVSVRPKSLRISGSTAAKATRSNSSTRLRPNSTASGATPAAPKPTTLRPPSAIAAGLLGGVRLLGRGGDVGHRPAARRGVRRTRTAPAASITGAHVSSSSRSRSSDVRSAMPGRGTVVGPTPGGARATGPSAGSSRAAHTGQRTSIALRAVERRRRARRAPRPPRSRGPPPPSSPLPPAGRPRATARGSRGGRPPCGAGRRGSVKMASARPPGRNRRMPSRPMLVENSASRSLPNSARPRNSTAPEDGAADRGEAADDGGDEHEDRRAGAVGRGVDRTCCW